MAQNRKQLIYGSIDADGRLKVSDEALFARIRGNLRGQEIQMLIEPRKKPRTLAENNYYWAVIIALLCDWSGYSPDEMHEALKEKFLSKYDKEHNLTRARSTATLSTVEMEDYLTAVRKWAGKQGVFIPLPNEQI